MELELKTASLTIQIMAPNPSTEGFLSRQLLHIPGLASPSLISFPQDCVGHFCMPSCLPLGCFREQVTFHGCPLYLTFLAYSGFALLPSSPCCQGPRMLQVQCRMISISEKSQDPPSVLKPDLLESSFLPFIHSLMLISHPMIPRNLCNIQITSSGK